MKPEPAPCPHCGAPARRFPYQHDANRFYFGCSDGGCAATYTDQSQAIEGWNRRINPELTEAWEIINVLTMMDIDRKEPWPRALEWLKTNEIHRKPPSMLAEVAGSCGKSEGVGGAGP